MTSFFFIILISLMLSLLRLRKYYWELNLVENVKSCADRDLTDMICIIRSLDREINLSYKMTDEEYASIKSILSDHKKLLIDSFFKNELAPLKLSPREFYLFSLYDYLNKHLTDIYYKENEMYIELSRKDYGSYGGRLYDAIYSITDYGIAYHKLFYSVSLYCENNFHVRKYLSECCLSSEIQRHIDNKQISISAY